MVVDCAALGPRALGGGPLEGDRLVRLVYVDEAGISSPEQEPYLVVAGVIVDGDRQLRGVSRHLDKIVNRHIPDEYKADFIFHATELFNGGGKVFKRAAKDDPKPEWPLERRLAIADELASIPRKFNLRISLGWIERARFPHIPPPVPMTPGRVNVHAHVTAYMICALHADHWLRQQSKDEICMMVVEDNDQARKLIRETQNENQNRHLEVTNEELRGLLPFKRIMEDPLFQPKRRSSVLQLADFCAYVCKRRFMRTRHYDRFFDVLAPWIVNSQEGQPFQRRG